jgi:hypothetical protein
VLDPLEPDPVWAGGAALLPGQAMPFASGALLGRDLYIVGGAMFSSVVARYEGGPSGGWAACPALGTPRVHAAVAAAAGRLFVCGGRSQVNQVRWGSRQGGELGEGGPGSRPCGAAWWTRAWCGRLHPLLPSGPTLKPAPRPFAPHPCQVLATVESYAPGAGAWEALPEPMSEARYAAGAASMGGAVYVVGGQSSRSAIFE